MALRSGGHPLGASDVDEGIRPWRDPVAIARRFGELVEEGTSKERIPEVIAQEFHLPLDEAHEALRELVRAEEERSALEALREARFRQWLRDLYVRPFRGGARGVALTLIAAALGIGVGGAVWYVLPPGRYFIAIAVIPALLTYRALFRWGGQAIYQSQVPREDRERL